MSKISDEDQDFEVVEEALPEHTREQLVEIREAFFAFSRDDMVRPKDLTYVLRALGIMLNEEEIDALVQECMDMVEFNTEDEEEGPRIITLDQLTQVLRGRMPDGFSESQILMAFATFDPNRNGYIETEELKRCLTVYGEKMTKRELKQILKLGDPDKIGFYRYDKVAQKLAS